MTDPQRLNKELISDPNLWRMSVEICPDVLQIVAQSALVDNSLLHRAVEIDETRSLESAVSDAIYDNPLLLADFGKIDLLIDTPRFMMMSTDIAADEDKRDAVMRLLWTDPELTFISNPIVGTEDALVMAVSTSLLALLRRTFVTAKIMHRLTPIITYFSNKSRLNNSSKLYVHLRPDDIDIIYIKNGKLHAVNSIKAPTTEDKFYYIMAVARAAGFVVDNDEVMLCGNPEIRESLSPMLRQYVSYVMPVVFPASLLLAGAEAIDSPFELIILPLCE